MKRKPYESDAEKHKRLSKAAKYKKDNQTKIHCVKKENCNRTKRKQTRKRSIHEANQDASKTTFLNEFDVDKNGPLQDQVWSKENMRKFHDSMKYTIVRKHDHLSLCPDQLNCMYVECAN